METPKKTSFLCLPGEVRNAIYALLLPEPGSTLPLGKDLMHPICFNSNPHNYTAIFLTCRHIRQEVSSLFYPCNTFTLSRSTQLPLLIRDLTNHTRFQLTHLTVSVNLNLSSLSRRSRRGRSLPTPDQQPISRNRSSSSNSTILIQNKELNHLSQFPGLNLLTLSLNIDACSLQRYLAPSHIMDLGNLVPSSSEITVEVARCAHCVHWHDSTSNPMESGDVERNRQWWRWTSPSVSISRSGEHDGMKRGWVLTRRIGGVMVDVQSFPLISDTASTLHLPMGSESPHAPSPHAEQLLSRCYTCKKTLLPSTTSPATSHFSSTSSGTLLSPTGQTCEVCGLVSFCSNLCFAACVEHQHLCVPRPFG